MLRAIIVDDEELSVKRLKRILTEFAEIEICHTFLNPLEACEYVKEHVIDVAFLDISMPNVDGLKLPDKLKTLDSSICVVFVTGHDEYALKAFDLNALDYLLKPVTVERFSKTLEKIKRMHHRVTIESSLAVLMFNGLKLFRQYDDKAALVLRSPKTEELFAFLMCKGSVSREEIIDTLWSDLDAEKALKNLNSTLYYIRKAVDADGTENYIKANRYDIWVNENQVYCDVYEFEQLLKRIKREPEQSASLFERAEALYTGEFLKGKPYEWATEKRRQLERNYMDLLESAARYYMQINQPQQSLHYFHEILKLDSIREDVNYEIIRIYLKLGRKNDALRQYRRLEEVLLHELGARPDPKIKQYIGTYMTN